MGKENPSCPFGNHHGEFKKSIEVLEANVSELWKRYNNLNEFWQGKLIGILTLLVTNLIGIIGGIILIYLK